MDIGVGLLELISYVAPVKDSVNDVSSLVNRGSDSFRRRFELTSKEMIYTSTRLAFSGSIWLASIPSKPSKSSELSYSVSMSILGGLLLISFCSSIRVRRLVLLLGHLFDIA